MAGQHTLAEPKLKVTPWRCSPTPPNQSLYQISTTYTFQILRYSPDKILKFKFTTARSKVNSRSHPDVAHLHLLTNVHTKYYLPTIYGSRYIAWTRFYRSRTGIYKVQSQIKVTPWQCTPTPLTNVPTKYHLPMPYGLWDILGWTGFLNLRSLCQGQRSKVTPWCCTPTPPTNIPTKYQLPSAYTLWFLRYSPDKLFSRTACPSGCHGCLYSVFMSSLEF